MSTTATGAQKPNGEEGPTTASASAGPDADADRQPAVPDGHTLITEGLARMIHPTSSNSVFYNPVQVQNRDLSVLMISLYAERRLKRAAVKARKKELLDEIRRRGVPQREWNVAGLQERVREEMDKVDWSKRARESSKSREGVRILEALAASGLRSVRYWKEIPGVRQVVINDLEEAAVELAWKNVEFNGLSEDLCRAGDPTLLGGGAGAGAGDGGAMADTEEGKGGGHSYYDGVRVQQSDATHEMYLSRRPPALSPSSWTPAQHCQHPQYDVIDLDPYGSASPFLDSTIQSIVHGGMLCVTCTDMAALGGSHPETCYGRYSSMPIQRGGYLQELALRILVKDCATAAARYGRTVRPVLSVGMAFYIRVFLEVYDDKKGVNDLSLHIGNVYQSARCPSFYTAPHGTFGKGGRKVYQPSRIPAGGICEETGGPLKVAGPCWLGPLHDADVVTEAVRRLELPTTPSKNGDDENENPIVHPFATSKPLHGLLTSVSEELPDVPLYYTLSELCRTVRCEAMPMKTVRAALHNAGYRSSAYHKEPGAIKTDAPPAVVWDVVRAWCKDHPPKAGKNKKESNAERSKSKRMRRKEERKRRRQQAGGNGGEDDVNGEKDDGGSGDGNKAGESCEGGSNKKDGSGGEKKEDEETMQAPPHQPTPGDLILARESSIEVDFTIPPGFGEGRKKAQRFPHNPSKNWGPKPKASGRGMVSGGGKGGGGGSDKGMEKVGGKVDNSNEAGGQQRKAPEEGTTTPVVTEAVENVAPAKKKKKIEEEDDGNVVSMEE